MPFGCFKKTPEYNISPSKGPHLRLKDCFFVISPIFNPVGYQSRYVLYKTFEKHIKSFGVQLITIECIFPSLNQNKFQVTQENNPNHIQIRSESIYWMKENLINIAVGRLPSHAKFVCWLDGDINFHSKTWVEKTIKQLQKYTVVQMFKNAKFLGPPPQNKILRNDYSFGYSVVNNKPIDQGRYDEWYPHPGYGWAMGIDAFREIGGLPDYDIVGSGDLHFAFSLLDRVSNTLENSLNPQFKAMILNHSHETYKKLQNISRLQSKQMVGFVPITISHNWHGTRKDRQYVQRWSILIAHQFNYSTDLFRNDEGLLQLMPNKMELQRDIVQHFQMRNEDAKQVEQVVKKPQKVEPVGRIRRRNSSSSSDEDFSRRQQRQQDQSLYYEPYHPRPWDSDNPCPWIPGDGNCPNPGNGDGPGSPGWGGECPDNGNGHGHHHSGHAHSDAGNYCDNYNGTINCTSSY